MGTQEDHPAPVLPRRSIAGAVRAASRPGGSRVGQGRGCCTRAAPLPSSMRGRGRRSTGPHRGGRRRGRAAGRRTGTHREVRQLPRQGEQKSAEGSDGGGGDGGDTKATTGSALHRVRHVVRAGLSRHRPPFRKAVSGWPPYSEPALCLRGWDTNGRLGPLVQGKALPYPGGAIRTPRPCEMRPGGQVGGLAPGWPIPGRRCGCVVQRSR